MDKAQLSGGLQSRAVLPNTTGMECSRSALSTMAATSHRWLSSP